MAFAIAEVGLSRSDLDLIIPEEFEAIVARHAKVKEERFKTDWERARFTALYSLAPYSKRAFKPKDVCVFEWEKNNGQPAELTPEEVEKVRKRGRELTGQVGKLLLCRFDKHPNPAHKEDNESNPSNYLE